MNEHGFPKKMRQKVKEWGKEANARKKRGPHV